MCGDGAGLAWCPTALRADDPGPNQGHAGGGPRQGRRPPLVVVHERRRSATAMTWMEAWGFTPRSPLTWIKPRLSRSVFTLSHATEHMLFGTRGKAPVLFRSEPNDRCSRPCKTIPTSRRSSTRSSIGSVDKIRSLNHSPADQDRSVAISRVARWPPTLTSPVAPSPTLPPPVRVPRGLRRERDHRHRRRRRKACSTTCGAPR